LALLIAMVLLAGCGRRGLVERFEMEQAETVTIDLQPTPVQNTMPPPDSATQAEESAAAPAQTATPESGQDTAPNANDADLNRLMDELDAVLDDLEDTIATADQDTMSDSALSTLGN
jgi:hypothetical protein